MKRLLKLIEEFSAREIAPIEVEHVVDYLRSGGVTDEIYFFNPKMDAEILQGAIAHWEYQASGWTYKVVDIYIAPGLTVEEQRLIQVKELLHILDHRIDRVSSFEDVQALIEQMALPISSANLATASDHAMSDHSALINAIPVVFPMAVRDLLLPLHVSGKITIEEIADRVALPRPIVELVMGETWPPFYKSMIAKMKVHHELPDRVHTFDSKQACLEIHSVALEDDPFIYAKRLEERMRDTLQPIDSLIVETRREKRRFSAREITEYTLKNPFKGSVVPR